MIITSYVIMLHVGVFFIDVQVCVGLSVCMYGCICCESGNVFIHLSVFRKCMAGALRSIEILKLSAIPIISINTFQIQYSLS